MQIKSKEGCHLEVRTQNKEIIHHDLEEVHPQYTPHHRHMINFM